MLHAVYWVEPALRILRLDGYPRYLLAYEALLLWRPSEDALSPSHALGRR